MDTKTKLSLGLVAIIVIGFFALGGTNDPQPATTTDGDSVEKAEKSDAMMADMKDEMADEMDEDMAEADPEDDGMDMEYDARAAKEAGRYLAYTPQQVELAAPNEYIILSFSATWCPSCRATDAELTKSATAAEIPSDVTILKVDYDTHTDLRKEYGVTTQHTFVLVDSTGTMIKKWVGGNNLGEILLEAGYKFEDTM